MNNGFHHPPSPMMSPLDQRNLNQNNPLLQQHAAVAAAAMPMPPMPQQQAPLPPQQQPPLPEDRGVFPDESPLVIDEEDELVDEDDEAQPQSSPTTTTTTNGHPQHMSPPGDMSVTSAVAHRPRPPPLPPMMSPLGSFLPQQRH